MKVFKSKAWRGKTKLVKVKNKGLELISLNKSMNSSPISNVDRRVIYCYQGIPKIKNLKIKAVLDTMKIGKCQVPLEM